MDYEVKADPLEAVFEGMTVEVPVVRPMLSGATRIADPARAAFVNGYLRRGSEVELKSFPALPHPKAAMPFRTKLTRQSTRR